MITVRLIGLILCCLLVSACGNKQEKAVTDAVRAFNRTLAEALAKPNPDLMADVATEKEQMRIGLFIASLLQKGQVMKCFLDSISFGPVNFLGADKAEVSTKEEWTFEYLDLGTRKAVEPPKKISYSVTYSLELARGDWLVAQLKINK